MLFFLQGAAGCNQFRLPETALRDEESQGGAGVPDENGEYLGQISRL